MTQTLEIYENGTYYFYAKNAENKIVSEGIQINKIDIEEPTITDITSPGEALEEFYLNTTLTDSGSGISKVVVNYKKEDALSNKTKEIVYTEMNGKQEGDKTKEARLKITGIASGTYDMYLDVYDVAGNMASSNTVNFVMTNYAAQIGNVKYMTLQEALDDVPLDGTETTIKLLDDIEENVVIKKDQNIIIDFNEHTIKGKVDTEPVIKVEEGVTLVLDGEGKIDAGSQDNPGIENNGDTQINGDVKVIGTVTGVEATVKFDSQGGTAVSSITNLINEKITTLPTTTLTGYTFEGWYTDKEEGYRIVEPYTITRNITLYAQWVPNTYTIIYDRNRK